MVHALDEIRRVLVPGGVLIDLRPVSDSWRVEVFSAREIRETGSITDTTSGVADDKASDQAMANVEANGWFRRESEAFFPIHYVWDTASEMEAWIAEEWEYYELEEATKRATRSTWALSDADSQVRVKVKMLIAKWRKV